MLKSMVYNDTMGEDTYNGQKLKDIFDECSMNEGKYRQIKKYGAGMFQSLQR